MNNTVNIILFFSFSNSPSNFVISFIHNNLHERKYVMALFTHVFRQLKNMWIVRLGLSFNLKTIISAWNAKRNLVHDIAKKNFLFKWKDVKNVSIPSRRSQMVGTGHKLIYNLIYHAWLMKYENSSWNVSSWEASAGARQRQFHCSFPLASHSHVIVVNTEEARGMNRTMSSQQTIKDTSKAKDQVT